MKIVTTFKRLGVDTQGDHIEVRTRRHYERKL